MRNSVAVLVLSALSFVAAQGGNFTIDPNSIDLTERASWCQGEYNTCKTLCANNPTANECDPTTLAFKCTCSNGTAPGLEFYTQTMPTFICLKAYDDCIQRTVGNSQGQDNCKTTILDKCGKLDPNTADVSAGAPASPSATTTGGSSSTPSGTGAPETKPTTNVAAHENFRAVANAAAAVAVGIFAYLV